ncbi:hypothetical protein D8674_013849 [Pyrus ussuriensis x Pyrus communis]|uniref:Uncharacterized protein n=1 Tax=Pyrus ussuriensis x Pyrus communis TaxID=2448454 RepID=A0A5N5GY03_9ROSA|nr:hypothetical protein D8674_013849 [Pyrus ussuriensis x Pyrus communis]
MDVASNQMSLKRSSSHSSSRSIDAQVNPTNISFQKLYPWPEAEKKLVRSLSVACAAPLSNNNFQSSYHKNLASRQRFLRSYTFRKEDPTRSLAKRIKNGSRATWTRLRSLLL